MIHKNLCRLLLTTDLSNREAGQRCCVLHNTAGHYRERLREEGLSWEQVSALSTADLDAA